MNRLLLLLLVATNSAAVGQSALIGSAFLTMEAGFETVMIDGCTIGETYALVVSGTFGVHNSNCNLGDAAFYGYPDPEPYTTWVWNDICDACQSTRPDHDLPSADHAYTFTFVAESAYQTFHFQDLGGSGDNCGGLMFEIYTPLIPGCTNSNACNFNPENQVDNGTCIFLDTCGVCGGDNSTCFGCMDTSACNFDSSALINGNCIYPLFEDDCGAGAIACGEGQLWIPESQQCVTITLFDSNYDGCVTGLDLLDFLAAFGYCLVP
jgi:hypothetical protein